MDLTVMDYAILVATASGFVIGIFIGVSGALAFLAGVVTAAIAGTFAWGPLAQAIDSRVLAVLALVVGALLVFGLVRFLVKKFVHGLVAQPGDAIFGSLLAALAALLVSGALVGALGALFPEAETLRSVLLEKTLILIGQ